MATDSLGRIDSRDGFTLEGTTGRVYQYLLRQGAPVDMTQMQSALGLSSPLDCQFHVEQLMNSGLVRLESGGYLANPVPNKDLLKIGRISVPVQTVYLLFYSFTLFLMLILVRPHVIDSYFFLAILVNGVALGAALYEMLRSKRRS